MLEINGREWSPAETWDWRLTKEARLEVIYRLFHRRGKKYVGKKFFQLSGKMRSFLKLKYNPEFQGFSYKK